MRPRFRFHHKHLQEYEEEAAGGLKGRQGELSTMRLKRHCPPVSRQFLYSTGPALHPVNEVGVVGDRVAGLIRNGLKLVAEGAQLLHIG